MNLEYIGIPEKDIAAFATAVSDTLSQLNLGYDFDSTSPPDEKGEVEYRVVNVTVISEVQS